MADSKAQPAEQAANYRGGVHLIAFCSAIILWLMPTAAMQLIENDQRDVFDRTLSVGVPAIVSGVCLIAIWHILVSGSIWRVSSVNDSPKMMRATLQFVFGAGYAVAALPLAASMSILIDVLTTWQELTAFALVITSGAAVFIAVNGMLTGLQLQPEAAPAPKADDQAPEPVEATAGPADSTDRTLGRPDRP